MKKLINWNWIEHYQKMGWEIDMDADIMPASTNLVWIKKKG